MLRRPAEYLRLGAYRQISSDGIAVALSASESDLILCRKPNLASNLEPNQNDRLTYGDGPDGAARDGFGGSYASVNAGPPAAESTAAATFLTKTDAAYLALRQAIVEGRYSPGERLTVAKLEEELSLSPTPIREALRLLQAHGYVKHESHRGVKVASYSSADVEEVYQLRLVLEPLACGLAAQNAVAGDLDKLWRIHKELVNASTTGQVVRAPQVNAQWHSALYAVARHQLLQEFIGRLWMSIPVQAIWNSDHGVESSERHEAIMNAVAAHDSSLASQLMRQHIETNRPRTNPIFGDSEGFLPASGADNGT
jgi:DNA-binding GntR family transcriptional regulator